MLAVGPSSVKNEIYMFHSKSMIFSTVAIKEVAMKFRLPHVGIYRQPLCLTQEFCMQREREKERGRGEI